MDMPIIPLTDPENQLEIATDFCTAWKGPIKLLHEGKTLVLIPYDHYLENYCTPEEAKRIDAEIAANIAAVE